jgi:hypothetical protein
MKATLLFILIIFYVACASPNGDIEIPIRVFDKSINKLSPNVASHKDKDVEIFSDNEKNRISYSCIIYRMDNGILRGYQVYTHSLNKYNKARYQWLNDSTVTFRLNNKFHISEKYTIIGYEGWTRLSCDD